MPWWHVRELLCGRKPLVCFKFFAFQLFCQSWVLKIVVSCSVLESGKGCCKESFRIYDPNTGNTDGDAPYLGMIMKRPKSAMTEIFTDASAFDVKFPKNATADQKGILIGTSIFINAVFFEGENDQAVGG